MAAAYSDQTPESGSVAGALHRGWMTMKDALSGSDPGGLLEAAEKGEDHAMSDYSEALQSDISPGLRTVVERQYSAVRQAHATIRSLVNQT